MPIEQQNSKNSILIKGARVHNLKNISLAIPRNYFTVITGLSGSGKSSLAFDTLYAEGQRRYVESLSSYARQFLGRINKPEVDYIKGIPPAIAIEQKVNTRNPRSTVGTSTEIYDYLKILFARVGRTYSPVSNNIVKRHTVTDVVNAALQYPEGTRFIIYSPYDNDKERDWKTQLQILLQQGFTRVLLNNDSRETKIEELLQEADKLSNIKLLKILIDRLAIANDEDTLARIADSVQTAFYEGKGACSLVFFIDGGEPVTQHFSNRFEADGLIFEEPSDMMFSFNNPLGACPKCEGFGKVIGIDEDLVVPNKSLSVYDEAVACWRGNTLSAWRQQFIEAAPKFSFPVRKPYSDLTPEQRKALWNGNKHAQGIYQFFEMLEAETYKIQNRVLIARYRGKTVCPECEGTRLKKAASYVKVGGRGITDLVDLSVVDLRSFFDTLQLADYEEKIARRLLIEIRSRIEFLCNVGLGYLTLNRLSSTLSGGESQRINLATSLGSSLVGSLYILDEPSIGLHSRDTDLLIKVLKQLKQLGNTVLVVEHDEEIIRAADQIIDIGPLAGSQGGEVVFQGEHSDLLKANSLTTKYLTGKERIEYNKVRRRWNNQISIRGVRENNLKGFDVGFPLNVLTVVTGVSGSGKSSLVKGILYPMLNKHFSGFGERVGRHDSSDEIKGIFSVEMVDQNPIGRSSRSNPVTYVKAYDEIRRLFAEQQASVINGFDPSHFSFNVDGGRCQECEGEGTIHIEMQFMADMELLCESCKGRRFKDEVLEVEYRGKNIYDILEMTIDDAIAFFGEAGSNVEKRIVQRMQPLADVGLGYVRLGQSSSTLSGGESQRIKLASFLSKEQKDKPALFIFDEPTTGLHFHDIRKLMKAFDALIDAGHSLIVVEHNMDVIKCADWVIDLGPDGGETGGNLVFAGTPENLVKCEASYTGKYLKDKLIS